MTEEKTEEINEKINQSKPPAETISCRTRFKIGKLENWKIEKETPEYLYIVSKNGQHRLLNKN